VRRFGGWEFLLGWCPRKLVAPADLARKSLMKLRNR